MNDMTPITSRDQILSDRIKYKAWILHIMLSRREQLEPALDVSDEGWTFEHVFEGVVKDQYWFWFNDHASAVIEPRNYPAGMVFHLFIAGGTQQGLFDLYKDVEAYGKRIGARKMTTLARHGFKRRLPKAGWTMPLTFFEKEF